MRKPGTPILTAAPVSIFQTVCFRCEGGTCGSYKNVCVYARTVHPFEMRHATDLNRVPQVVKSTRE